MKSFTGAFTALITPFDDEGQMDQEGLIHLIRRQIKNGIDGLVVLGTTGEAPTLTKEEKKLIIEVAKKECHERTTFIIGTGSYSTRQAIEDTLSAELAGADAALIVTPYYNRPTQEGLYQHFKAIAHATNLPIIIYNIAGRTGQNMQTETLARLLEIPAIVGIKEASGNISQINDVIHLTKAVRPDFSVLSGDDALTLPMMALGGDGVISVISNVFPLEVKNLVESISGGDFELAREIHFRLMPMVKLAFMETNPIPIKAMHRLFDLPAGVCRLPLCGLSRENALKLQEELLALISKNIAYPKLA